MATKYYNTNLGITDSGGAVRVSLVTNVGQGNGGTSLATRGCYISAADANSAVVVVNIGTSASVSLGMEIPESQAGSPLYIPIDDVSKLYFYSTDTDAVVDILYFT